MKNSYLSASFISTDIRSVNPKIKFVFIIFMLCMTGVSLPVLPQTNKPTNKSGNSTDQQKKTKTKSKTSIKSSKPGAERTLSQNLGSTANIFYVAPNGTASGTGSISNPWDLKTAFAHPAAVQPGDTIYLRGGTYNVPTVDLGFTSRLKGTPENPIKVISYPGEWAKIDGNLSHSQIKNIIIITINGSYTWYKDFEIMNSETATRKIAISGSNPSERRGEGVRDQGIGTRLINLIIHDTGLGISSYSSGRNAEYYGNIVYNNGWDAPDRLHGQGNYTQNNSDFKRFEDNIFFNAFRHNSQMYGSNAAFCRNFTWIGNIMFNGDMAWWGPKIENLVVKENHFYNQRFTLGNAGVDPTNTNADLQSNHFMNGVSLDEMAQHINFKNNTVWCRNDHLLVDIITTSFWTPAKYTFDNNTYYNNVNFYRTWGSFRVWQFNKKREFALNSTDQPQRYAGTKKSWQEDLRMDLNSSYINTAPTGTKVFLRPNKYDSGRAHVIIYNWDNAAAINIDTGTILKPGDNYELRNVQDYFGDIITATYSGGQINISMTGRSAAKPIGYDQVSSWYHDPLKPSTFPQFGVFVLIKTN